MTDETPLAAAITSTVGEFLAGGEDPGMMTKFFFVMSVTTADGDDFIQVARPGGQDHPTTLGLISWSEEFLRDDIRTSFHMCDMDDE